MPAVADGLVLTGVRGGLAAFDTATGALRWRAQFLASNSSRPWPRTIVIYDHVACLLDSAGVGCVAIKDGRVVWSDQQNVANEDETGATDGDLLYYGTRDHRVIARSFSTGAVKWIADLSSDAPFLARCFGVALRGDTVYATQERWLNPNGFLSASDLVALDAGSGRELWRYTTAAGDTSSFWSPPVFAGNLAVVTDIRYHGLRAIDLSTHREVWRSAKDLSGYIDTSGSTPIVLGDTVFAGSTDTQVYALDVRTGLLRWRAVAAAGSLTSVAFCGNQILALLLGDPIAINRQTHAAVRARILAKGDFLDSGAGVDGNSAYVVSEAGLYGFACK